MKAVICLGRLFLQILYQFYKISPQKNEILIVSRQSNEPSLDVRLLEKKLQVTFPDYKINVMCRYSKSAASIDFSYMKYVMGPLMKAFARAKIVILDGYCIPASMLQHRPKLRIIQMWHAMGCFKKFGFATLGQEGGYDPSFAKMMHMHENYDYIFASSDVCVEPFRQAFHARLEQMKVMPLPRVDFIRQESYKEACKERIYQTYPQLMDGRKVILYAPTFRKNGDNEGFIRDFANAIDKEKYHLVIKPHPIVKEIELGSEVICDHQYQSIEMLAVCDYVVSDYSAFVLEAALAEKPIFCFVPDEEEYLDKRGFFVDITKEWPGVRSKDASDLAAAIAQEDFDLEQVKLFAEKYVNLEEEATEKIALFIKDLLKDL